MSDHENDEYQAPLCMGLASLHSNERSIVSRLITSRTKGLNTWLYVNGWWTFVPWGADCLLVSVNDFNGLTIAVFPDPTPKNSELDMTAPPDCKEAVFETDMAVRRDYTMSVFESGMTVRRDCKVSVFETDMTVRCDYTESTIETDTNRT